MFSSKGKRKLWTLSLFFSISPVLKPFLFWGKSKDFLKLWPHIGFLYDWLAFQSLTYLCTTIFLLIFRKREEMFHSYALNLKPVDVTLDSRIEYLFLAVVQNGLWYSCSQPLSNFPALTHLNYDILCIASFTSMLWNKRAGRAAISSCSHSAWMPNAYTVTPINWARRKWFREKWREYIF